MKIRREIFGLITMRGKKEFGEIPPEGTLEVEKLARNVIRDETRKWEKLCRMFDMYKETHGLIFTTDLEEIVNSYSTHEKHAE